MESFWGEDKMGEEVVLTQKDNILKDKNT